MYLVASAQSVGNFIFLMGDLKEINRGSFVFNSLNLMLQKILENVTDFECRIRCRIAVNQESRQERGLSPVGKWEEEGQNDPSACK